MRRYHKYASAPPAPLPPSTDVVSTPLAQGLEVSLTQVPDLVSSLPTSTPVSSSAPESASSPSIPTTIEPGVDLTPVAKRLYPLYLKLDPKRFLSDADLNTVCRVVAGDKRRIIERVLLGVYQRAHLKKDYEEVKRSRLYLQLHEAEELEKNLEGIGE